jgi:hypothetical protein
MNEPFLKGQVQPPAYRDVNFAYAFAVNVIGVVLTTVFYGPAIFQGNSSNEEADDDTSDDSSGGSFLVVMAFAFLAAILTNIGLLSVMARYSHAIVQVSLFTAPLLLFGVALCFFFIDTDAGAALCLSALLFFLISCMLYFCYQRFVPFAASTLKTAMSVIRYHQGLYFVSLGGIMLSFMATIVYVIALAGIFATAEQKGRVVCKDLYDDPDGIYQDDEMCMTNPPNGLFMFLLLLSAFWTQEVIQNVVRCTCAGTVGDWWFSGLGDPSWCSHEISHSFHRAMTHSFGSICFGSLLVAILQTLEEMAKSARRNRRGALLACVLECLLYVMRRWLEYFNSWAFCYVGLYGYDYLTAGKNVIQLFQNQGWSTFASDRLIFRVLYASQLTIALVSGGIATLIDTAVGGSMVGVVSLVVTDTTDDISDATASHVTAFLLGLLLGLILSRCSLFVVESAVRTIIICFAESPADFQEHHPQLCQEMREGWAAAYPDVWTEDFDIRFAEVLPTPSSISAEEEKKSLMLV